MLILQLQDPKEGWCLNTGCSCQKELTVLPCTGDIVLGEERMQQTVFPCH